MHSRKNIAVKITLLLLIFFKFSFFFKIYAMENEQYFQKTASRMYSDFGLQTCKDFFECLYLNQVFPGIYDEEYIQNQHPITANLIFSFLKKFTPEELSNFQEKLAKIIAAEEKKGEPSPALLSIPLTQTPPSTAQEDKHTRKHPISD